MMLYDNENGRRWEYINHHNGKYTCKYSEYYKQIGWKQIGESYEICKEDYYEALSEQVNQLRDNSIKKAI